MIASQLRRRGFSLIELMLAVTIMLFAIVMAGAAMSLQNKSLQSMDLTRVANSASRDAMLSLEGGLRQAGWGVDPRYAFDFFGTAGMSSFDSKTAPDIVSFISRDPYYQWIDFDQVLPPFTVGGPRCTTVGGCFVGHAFPLTSVSTTSPFTVTAVAAFGMPIPMGQEVLIVCLGATFPVLLRNSANVTAGATTLTPMSAAAFPYNETGSIQACHSQPGATMFLVNRSRYFIQQITVSSVVTHWLMLDQGIDLDGDNTLGSQGDWIPIAKNVEDLQVAYVFNGALNPADSNANGIIGDDPAVAIELPAPPANNASAPTYTKLPNDASRFTSASANIRAVRISLILRSNRPDPNQRQGWAGDIIRFSENRFSTTVFSAAAAGCPASGTPASPCGLRRFSIVSEIALRNLESTRPFTY